MSDIGSGTSIDVIVPSVPGIDVVIPVVVTRLVNGIALTDNGDGTVTVTSSGSTTITDNGDGTVTLNAI